MSIRPLSRDAIVHLELVGGKPLFVHSDLSRKWESLMEAHNEQSGDAGLCELAERLASDD